MRIESLYLSSSDLHMDAASAGDQLHSVAEAQQYSFVLQRGARCVEIDCWDGDDPENPIVTHGHTLVCEQEMFEPPDVLQISCIHGAPIAYGAFTFLSTCVMFLRCVKHTLWLCCKLQHALVPLILSLPPFRLLTYASLDVFFQCTKIKFRDVIKEMKSHAFAPPASNPVTKPLLHLLFHLRETRKMSLLS